MHNITVLTFIFVVIQLANSQFGFVFPDQFASFTNPNRPTTTYRTTSRATTTYRTTKGPVIVSNVNFNGGGRISERKCQEYTDNIGQEEEQFASLAGDSSAQQFDTQQCESSTSLVVGGEDAKLGEFPHMVAIGYRQKYYSGRVGFHCGGTLISEKFVLTAAHCRMVDGIRPTVVRVGDLNLAKPDEGLPELDVPIAEFISHERYVEQKHPNDIALIRLKYNVQFSTLVHPACLAQPNLVLNRNATASGWGLTDIAGPTADHLQKVDLNIISNNYCSRLLRKIFNDPDGYNIDSTRLCAGILEGGKDTCNGDSGGPLTVAHKNNNCMHVLIGLTSYGSHFCGQENSPAVYTRISAYLDWIEPRVWR